MVGKDSEAMNSSATSSEVGSKEDVVQALLEYLVAPMLPLKASGREAPSLDQQQQVAKQVHAVVLLYNYYHRKQRAGVEFLAFENFCKLAVVLKPTLMAHMKLMHRPDYAEVDDLEDQLSLTEKAIMDACNISLVLDASKDVPNIEGWPVSKVAVLLTDSRRENCLLQFSSTTHGVWSLIEKSLDVSPVSSEGKVEGKHVIKRKRSAKKPLKDASNVDEADCRQLAFSAVKDITGINQSDLVVLESHVVYSLSKEKTAVRFYIVQCPRSLGEDVQLPIKNIFDSMQGPLVRKSFSCWTVTSVVEYFHVLPYAGVLTGWFSRNVFSTSLQDVRVDVKNVDVSSPQRMDNFDKATIEVRDEPSKDCNEVDIVGNLTSISNIEPLEQKDNEVSSATCLSDSSAGPQHMDVDDSSVVCHQNQHSNKSAPSITKVYHHQRRMPSPVESDLNDKPSDEKIKVGQVDYMSKTCIAEFKDEKMGIENNRCSTTSSDQLEVPPADEALVPSQLNPKYIEKQPTMLASKEQLSRTALTVLIKKRSRLSSQLRDLEDEIAICDKKIHAILDGQEDDLALKIEAIIEACNDDICLKGEADMQDKNHQHFEGQGSPLCRRKLLSEAVLTLRNSCQELDDICYENNWTLPTYHVSSSTGGFQAHVNVKAMDFECSAESDMHSGPRLARESAARKVIAKLRNMAGQSQ